MLCLCIVGLLHHLASLDLSGRIGGSETAVASGSLGRSSVDRARLLGAAHVSSWSIVVCRPQYITLSSCLGRGGGIGKAHGIGWVVRAGMEGIYGGISRWAWVGSLLRGGVIVIIAEA